MAIDRKFYGALRADIESAFKQVAEKHGLKSLSLGKIGVDYMGGFRATVQGVTGSGVSPEESNYNTTRQYSRYELPEIGALIELRGQRWRIIGQKTRGGHRIIADKVPQGGRYLLPVDSFERNFLPKPEGAKS